MKQLCHEGKELYASFIKQKLEQIFKQGGINFTANTFFFSFSTKLACKTGYLK